MRGVNSLLDKNNGLLVLDGGTTTALLKLNFLEKCNLHEAYKTGGYGLSSMLTIRDHPEVLKQVHQDYYENGADISITATYNTNIEPYLGTHGIQKVSETQKLLRKGVQIANQAQDSMKQKHNRDVLVAASCGPYGSFGFVGTKQNPFSGSYGKELGVKKLQDAHRERFEQLVDTTNSDIVAFETLPCLEEVEAVLNLIKTRPGCKAWITIVTKDDTHLCSGDKITDFVKLVEKLDTEQQCEAIGVNCLPPQYVTSIVKQMRALTSRILVVYPNNGDIFNPLEKKWETQKDTMKTPQDFANEALKWREFGGRIIIGGCCRTDNEWINVLSKTLRSNEK